MRVLVTGAYGLIGSACLARLHADGHELVAAGRSIAVARRRMPYARWVVSDFARLRDAATWSRLLADFDAVVNCVGVLQDGARDDVGRIQYESTVALFDGCVRAGVKRVVHISAIGAAADGPSAFATTKAAAEAHLKKLALDWAIVRPALVLAPGVYGGTAMLRGLAAFPGIVPVIAADAAIQIVGVDDVADTVARLLAPGAPSQVVWDVAHPAVHRLADIVTALREWLGFPPRRVLRLPKAVGKVVAVVGDALGWLGWRSPARTTSLAQLSAGVVGDPEPWMQATGIRPQSLAQILAARPSVVQDRWFARLYLIKPLAIAGLAAAAILPSQEALVTFWQYRHELDGVRLYFIATGPLPSFILYAAMFAAGLGLLVRATARLSLIAFFVASLLEIADHAVRHWALFHGPYHEFMIKLPTLLAILLTLAIMDER
jgi:uncharacterized protein YbjT (DUF2867 family)